jgi:hypothetical protein
MSATIRATNEEKMGKRATPGPYGGAPLKYRLVYTPPTGQPHDPPPPSLWGYRPPQQVAPHPPAYLQQSVPPRPSQAIWAGYPCFNCGHPRNFPWDCSQPQQGYSPKIPLELAGLIFPTNLIILEVQEIDIILGMRWMKMHKALLDISIRLVHLDSPVNGKVTLHLPTVARPQVYV